MSSVRRSGTTCRWNLTGFFAEAALTPRECFVSGIFTSVWSPLGRYTALDADGAESTENPL